MHQSSRALGTLLFLVILVTPTWALLTSGNPRGQAVGAAQCDAVWQPITAAIPLTPGLALSAVTVAASNDTWAVGTMAGAGGYNVTAALHWNGREATFVPSVNLGTPGASYENRLLGADARQPNDVWAVGWHSVILHKQNRDFSGSEALIEHWNGASWVTTPPPAMSGGKGSRLQAVVTLAANDVWAAGRTEDEGPTAPLLAHWDGSAWLAATLPATGVPNAELVALTAIAPNDIWAVGSYSGTAGGGALLEHWNGSAWSMSKIPAPASATAGLTAEFLLRSIAATAANDVWAVGSLAYYRPSNQPRVPPVLVSLETYITHWDGTSWQRVASPNLGNGGYLLGVTATARNNVLAVGSYTATGGARPITLRWNGSAWAQENTPASEALLGVDALASGESWALGKGSLLRYSAPCATPSPTIPPVNPADRVPDPHDANATYYALVGHTLRGPFRSYWQSHGGLAQFGYPITEEFLEQSATDGKNYIVQYFERNRFEYHPENQPPYQVLLGLLGRTITKGRESEAPFKAVRAGSGTGRYFGQTGHYLAPQFAAYWDDHGGLSLYGYPISEAFQELSLTDGKTYLVQYFERNRFELHPENQPPYNVLLGLLGTQVLKQRGWIR